MIGPQRMIEQLGLIVALVFGCGVSVADDRRLPAADELLRRIVAFDGAFLDGITLGGSLTSSASGKNGKSIEFTARDGRCGLRETRKPPTFSLIDRSIPVSKDFDSQGRKAGADGSLAILSEDRAIYLFDSSQSARMNVHIEYHFGPDGKLVGQADRLHRVVLYPVDDITLLIPKVRILWSLGRGFSPFLDEVTEVSASEDGLLQVTAKGRTMANSLGQWILKIDPDHGDLIRSAVWSATGTTEGSLKIETSGLQMSGTLPHPTRGTFAFDMSGQPVEYSVEIASVVPTFDDQLYSEINRVFSGKYPANTNVHDRRSSPETYYFVNPQGKISGESRERKLPVEALNASGRSRQLLILVFGNMAIIAVFALFYFVRQRRSSSTAAPPE